MSKSPYSVEQRLAFINECYTSGLSVYAWCKENNISSGTFYSWIYHLKKQGCQLPEVVPISLRNKPIRESHEIVKINIVDETKMITNVESQSILETEEIPAKNQPCISIRIADAILDINESVNPAFISQVLKAVRHSL